VNRRNAANRKNAKRSTGPKSAAGKRVVRFNGLRHGLLSRDAVLPGEDKAAFQDLQKSLLESLVPLGPLESFLVDRIAAAMWRLLRAEATETATLAWRMLRVEADRLQDDAQAHVRPFGFDFNTIVDEASYRRAVLELDRAKDALKRDNLLLGRAFDADANEGDTFGKLARYESHIERGLYRSLHELQRLQAARQGRPMPLPQAVDIDISA
jgi:hypothetical protein